MTMFKIDYKREMHDLYRASAKPVLVEVPELKFLTITGQGDPATSQAWADAMQALYKAAYAIKFELKQPPDGLDYVVMPLEAQWWADDIDAFLANRRAEWQWKAMILQPPIVDEATLSVIVKNEESPASHLLRLETITEGLSAQVLHVGPYDGERPTIERLHAFIMDQGHVPVGCHHEIYIGDPRRTVPERLKTILRQPCE